MTALPEPSPCLAEELIDISTYWLTLLSRLVHRVVTGDAVARYEEEEIERLMASDAMMDVRPVDALNDKINALKYVANQPVRSCHKTTLTIATARCMAGMLVQCQERCQKTWDGTNFHRPPPATPNDPTDAPRPANTGLALSVVNRSSQRPTLPLLPASPPIPTIISPQALTTTRSFVEDDVDEDRDDNEAEEIVLRSLEQLGTARGKGRHACPLGTACHKDGWDAHGQPRIFEQNGAYRLATPRSLFWSLGRCRFIKFTSYRPEACQKADVSPQGASPQARTAEEMSCTGLLQHKGLRSTRQSRQTYERYTSNPSRLTSDGRYS
ncbi:MAG: hypothetical protein LQ349_004152 [Xanthoria aureola]|nr:MAG: hypothetical protein LQ349_004152 [Xanthoria aureola]